MGHKYKCVGMGMRRGGDRRTWKGDRVEELVFCFPTPPATSILEGSWDSSDN